MSEPSNRVVQVRRFGGPDELEVVGAPLPTAGRGEVRVRVLASSVNYTEVLIRCRLYPQTMRLQPPFVLGYDVVAEIDQLGDGVRGFQVGDRVADMTVVGSNATYRTLRADDLARVQAPTLVISLEDDFYRTIAPARLIAAHIPGARLLTYASGGHALVGHEAELFAEVGAFLRQH